MTKEPIHRALALGLLALLLAACGQTTATPNEVTMAAADFSPTTLTITAGQAVHFTDPVGTGGTHIICLGADGTCDASAQGPQALHRPGFTINAGDSPKDVTFESPGTYKVTCSIHSHMNLTIIVR